LPSLQAFTGVVDELRVWTAVRSAAQILASYEGAIDVGTDPDASELSISWKFDAAGLTRGSSLVDSSGNGNSGLVGMMDTTEDQLQFSTGRSSQVCASSIAMPYIFFIWCHFYASRVLATGARGANTTPVDRSFGGIWEHCGANCRWFQHD
jgi:hypothetical protein